MNLLFVTADLGFPPRTGPQDQTLMLLRYLSEQGHRCRLVALHRPGIGVDPQALNKEIPGLQSVGLFSWKYNFAIETLLAILPGKLTGPASFFGRRNAIRRAISEAVSDIAPDIVHFDGIALAPYLGLAVGSPIVLSLTDAVSLMQQRLARENPSILGKVYRWSAARMALQLERAALPKATKVQIVSESDRVYLSSKVRNAQVEYIGLAVSRETLALGGHKRAGSGGLRLFFSSDLRIGHLRRGLLWFLAEVFPKVARSFPGTRLSIVGKGVDTPEVQQAVADLPGASVSSWVSDYDAELAMADVVVVPDPCGGGTKNRVLRAMAVGRPVVGTPAAFEGISFENGVGGYRCQTAREFEKSLVSLLANLALRARIGEAGRYFVQRNHAIDVIGKQWLDLYNRAIVAFQSHSTVPSSDETLGSSDVATPGHCQRPAAERAIDPERTLQRHR